MRTLLLVGRKCAKNVYTFDHLAHTSPNYLKFWPNCFRTLESRKLTLVPTRTYGPDKGEISV